MLGRRFDRTGSNSGSSQDGNERNSLHLVPSAPQMRYECTTCGAHAVGLIASSTKGNWCSTCGGNELVPIETIPSVETSNQPPL